MYIVKKGDTLSEIAEKNHTTIGELVKLNHIKNKDLIYEGQKIKMPEKKIIKHEEKKEGGKMAMYTPFIVDAQRLQVKTGIPASITLGQIVLESSGRNQGGLSGLAVQGKNLFGIKGIGNDGFIIMQTNEVINGKTVTVDAKFRKYKTFYDSMVDHAELLSKPRYAKYLSSAKSVNDYAEGIKKGGYATDTNYVSKLLNIIASNQLHKYDIGSIAFKPLHGETTSSGSGGAGGGSSLGSKVLKVVESPITWGVLFTGLLLK